MQISSLSVVTEAVSEAAYLYAELDHMGADMRYIDCGGGLGIDYDGTASESHSSLPFTIQVRPCFEVSAWQRHLLCCNYCWHSFTWEGSHHPGKSHCLMTCQLS